MHVCAQRWKTLAAKVGLFTGPAEVWSQWVVGGAVYGYKASPAGVTVQITAATSRLYNV